MQYIMKGKRIRDEERTKKNYNREKEKIKPIRTQFNL